MLGSAVFSFDKSEKLTILVKAEHEDFPTKGLNSTELLVFPSVINDVLDLGALRDQVAGVTGTAPIDEHCLQVLKAEEDSLGGLLPNLQLSMLSFAIRHGLGLPYRRSSLKVIVPASDLRPNPSNSLEMLLPFRPEPLIPIDYYKVLDILGISGEWFVGKVRGIVSHVISGSGEGLSPRTRLVTQAASSAVSYATAFLLETGYTLVSSSMKTDVPLKDGDVILLRGWVDKEHSDIRVTTILRISSLEMWSMI